MNLLGGWIEFEVQGDWFQVVKISALLGRHHDLSGCLFGVDNTGGFDPLFARRGFPEDSSIEDAALRNELIADGRTSWVLWSELKDVDWEERCTVRDERISEFAVDPDGTERLVTKWLNSLAWPDVRSE